MSGKFTIMIVDDEPDTRFLLKAELMEEEDYEIVVASNGQEALLEIEESPPDVLLLDVMMPGMTGFEVCQLLKSDERWQHIPIILITALSGKRDLARGFALGADDFIEKPVSNIELRARVRSMVRLKQQYDRLEQQRQQLEATLYLREELDRVTSQRLAELEALHHVGLNLLNSQDVNYMVEMVAQKTLELVLQAAYCIIHFPSADGQSLIPLGFPDEARETNPWLSSEDKVRQAIESKETIYIRDLLVHSTVPDSKLRQMYTIFIIPLVVDERVIGTFSIDSPKFDAFDASDKRILSILANQLAISIIKVQLFDRLSSQG